MSAGAALQTTECLRAESRRSKLRGRYALPSLIHRGLSLISSLIVLVSLLVLARSLPQELLLEVTVSNVLVALVTGLLLLRLEPGPRQLAAGTILAALLLLAVNLVMTTGAIAAMPLPIAMQNTAPALGFAPWYRLVGLLLAAYLSCSILSRRWRTPLDQVGLVMILVYSTLNGSFFQIPHSPRMAVLWGLTLVVALLQLGRTRQWDTEAAGFGPGSRSILVAAALFALLALLSTITSVYVHASLQQLLGLLHWMVVCLLVVGAVRSHRQVARLIAVMLVMAAVAAAAGLASLPIIADQIGWENAVQVRMRLGYMNANGSGIFAATMLTMAAGMWPLWRARRQRLALLAVIGLLLPVLLLTSSRSALAGVGLGLATLLLVGRRGSRISGSAAGDGHPPPRSVFVQALGADRQVWLRLAAVALILCLGLGIAALNRNDMSVSRERAVLTKVALNTVRHHPLLGIGINNHFTPCFSDVLSHREYNKVSELVGTHTHNLLLEIAQGMGLVGLAAFLWLVAVVCRYASRALRAAEDQSDRVMLRMCCAALAALLPPHLLALSLSDASLLPARFWLLLGLLVATGRIATAGAVDRAGGPLPAPEPRLHARPFAAAVVCCAAVLLVLAPVAADRLQEEGAGARLQQRLPEAREAFTRLARLRPLHDRPLVVLAELADDPEEAMHWYREAVARRPLSAAYQRKLGWLAWQQNLPEQALQAFTRAVELDPHGADGGLHQVALALLCAATGRREQALAALNDALLHDPYCLDGSDWYQHKGGLALDTAYTGYLQRGTVGPRLAARIDYHLGRPGSRRVPRDRPGRPELFLHDLAEPLELQDGTDPDESGLLVYRWARLAEAARAWRQEALFEHCQQHAEALTEAGSELDLTNLCRRGKHHRMAGRFKQAAAAFRQALVIADIDMVRYELGLVYRDQGEQEQSLVELQLATVGAWNPAERYSPLHVCPRWRALAMAHQSLGQLEAAIRAQRIRQFLSAEPSQLLEPQLAIAQLQAQLDRDEQAIVTSNLIIDHFAALRVGPAKRERVLQSLAMLTAEAYQRLGVSAGQARFRQRQIFRSQTLAVRRYLELLTSELEERTPYT